MFDPIDSPATPCHRRHSIITSVLSSLLCATLFCAAAGTQSAGAQVPRRSARHASVFKSARHAPQPVDRVLVKLKPGVDAREFVRRCNTILSANAVALQAPGIDRALAAAPMLTYLHANKIGWHLIRVGDPARVDDVVATLAKQPEVRVAQPDHRVTLLQVPPLAAPNDNYWGGQNWQDLSVVLAQVDSDQSTATADDPSYWTYSWSLETVNALAGWNVYPGKYYTAADRTNASNYLPLIGDIDTGTDMTHPDFSYTSNPGGAGFSYVYNFGDPANGIPETDPLNGNPDPTAFASATVDTDVVNGGQLNIALSRSFIDGEYPVDQYGNPDYAHGDPIYAIDGFGHGTSTAGVIGAAANKRYGIPGLAYCCQIVTLKAIDNTGSGGEAQIEDAMMYAADNGCVAVNMSLAIDGNDYSQAMQDAVDYCWNHGTLVIAAGGNDNNSAIPTLGAQKRWPAACNRVLAVSASTWSWNGTDHTSIGTTIYPETLASYSNYGPHIGVSAPGGDVTTFNANNGSDFETIAYQSGVGGQEYVLPFVIAPRYQVALSDPNNPEGAYAANNLYGVDNNGITALYGTIPGTSFACPHVVGLAALYAAKNNITAATPNACQRIVNAIERGAANVQGQLSGGLASPNLMGYGRIDVKMTLRDSNARHAIVGGLVGQVKVGDSLQGYTRITAFPARNGVAVAHGRSFTATSGPDGIYRLLNLPLQTGVNGGANGYNVSCSINYINSKGRVARLTQTRKNVKVVPGCSQLGIDIIFN